MKIPNPERVTETYIAKLTYPPGLINQEVCAVRDSEVHKLYIRIYPTNGKAYFVRYPKPQGKGYVVEILGDTQFLTLRQARDRALEILHVARQAKAEGVTVEEIVEAPPQVPTVAEFAERFLSEHAAHKRSHRELERIIRRHIIPSWGERQLDRLTPGDMLGFKKRHADTPYECNRTLDTLKTMLNIAAKWRVLPRNFENPVDDVERFREKPRERVLSHDEMRRLVAAIDDEPSQVARALFQLLATVPLRRGEAVRAKWEDLDLVNCTLRVEDLSDHKKSSPQPLPPDLAKALGALPRKPDNPYIFVNRAGDSHVIHIEDMWRRMLTRAGVEGVRIHDLRRTIATSFAAAGANEYEIQGMLGHTTSIASRAYVHRANAADVTRTFFADRMNAIRGEETKRVRLKREFKWGKRRK